MSIKRVKQLTRRPLTPNLTDLTDERRQVGGTQPVVSAAEDGDGEDEVAEDAAEVVGDEDGDWKESDTTQYDGPNSAHTGQIQHQ